VTGHNLHWDASLRCHEPFATASLFVEMPCCKLFGSHEAIIYALYTWQVFPDYKSPWGKFHQLLIIDFLRYLFKCYGTNHVYEISLVADCVLAVNYSWLVKFYPFLQMVNIHVLIGHPWADYVLRFQKQLIWWTSGHFIFWGQHPENFSLMR